MLPFQFQYYVYVAFACARKKGWCCASSSPNIFPNVEPLVALYFNLSFSLQWKRVLYISNSLSYWEELCLSAGENPTSGRFSVQLVGRFNHNPPTTFKISSLASWSAQSLHCLRRLLVGAAIQASATCSGYQYRHLINERFHMYMKL